MKLGTLITVKQLAEAFVKFPKHLRVLDASWHVSTSAETSTGHDAIREYIDGHIPGSLFFDLEECRNKTSRYWHMLPDPDDFEHYVGELGIKNDTHVVLYENNAAGFYSSPRAWWNFRVFGHRSVSLLDGGLSKWIAEGHPISEGTTNVQKEKFKADFNPDLIMSLGEVLENVKSRQFQLVDTRPRNRFVGIDEEPSGIPGGHIPGSINLPSKELMTDNKDATFQTLWSTEELREIFQNSGVDLSKPLATTCGAAITACNFALAAFVCGNENVKVYDGSWMEYYERVVKSEE